MTKYIAAVLTKVRSTHDMLELDTYTGYVLDRPAIGESFYMQTREEGALWTTPVKVIRFLSECEVEFDTRNSTYKLTYVDSSNKYYISPMENDELNVFTHYGVADKLGMIQGLRNLERKLCGSR